MSVINLLGAYIGVYNVTRVSIWDKDYRVVWVGKRVILPEYLENKSVIAFDSCINNALTITIGWIYDVELAPLTCRWANALAAVLI